MTQVFSLQDKVAIVTGGASNIGRSVALKLFEAGAKVVIADMDENAAERVRLEVTARDSSSSFLVHKTDVTDPQQITALVEFVVQRFGRIDVLVNSVGWTVDRLFLEKSPSEWEREVRLNLWSVIYCTAAVLPIMIKQQQGSVISIGSDAGRMGEYREAVYSATKGGVIALSKSLAREYGPKQVRFNVVCPGLTVPATADTVGAGSMWADPNQASRFTPETLGRAKRAYPLRRLGRPEDVAAAVLFFASDGSSFITGQTLSVSGGYCML